MGGCCKTLDTYTSFVILGVPLATEPGISLIILPLMRILRRLQTHTTDTFLLISHTTNVLLYKFRCIIFLGVRIIKEMHGSVASVTYCISPLWSSGQSFWLQIQRSRVRSPALPDFLSGSGSGTGSTQPREVKLRSYLNKKVAAPGSENRD